MPQLIQVFSGQTTKLVFSMLWGLIYTNTCVRKLSNIVNFQAYTSDSSKKQKRVVRLSHSARQDKSKFSVRSLQIY